MRAENRAYTIDSILILSCVSGKSIVNSFFKGCKSVSYLNYVCAEDLHSCDVGSLLFDINRAHIDITFKSEICRCGSEVNTVLTCAGFCDDLLFAHVFSKEGFAHAVIELMRACVVKVLALYVELNVAVFIGKALKIGHGGRSSLKFLTYLTKLCNKL